MTQKKNVLGNKVVDFVCDSILQLNTDNFYELAEFLISKTYVEIKDEKDLVEKINWDAIPLNKEDMQVIAM